MIFIYRFKFPSLSHNFITSNIFRNRLIPNTEMNNSVDYLWTFSLTKPQIVACYINCRMLTKYVKFVKC